MALPGFGQGAGRVESGRLQSDDQSLRFGAAVIVSVGFR